MKKFKHLLCALAIIVFCIPMRAHAQNAQNFSFESFNADYSLDRSSEGAATMSVKETLVADFPDANQNHGILRAIPERYKGHNLRLKNISVTDNAGKPYQFTTTDENDDKVLKIGDPNTYVHGKVIYVISYQLQDVISFYNDHDELFWDVNGDQWDQSFKIVTATFHIAPKLADSLQDRRLCYAGSFGSMAQNCSITLITPQSETLIVASATNVQARQTLSAVLAFKPGTFQLSSAAKKDQRNHKIALAVAAVMAAGLPLGAAIFMFRRWRAFGNDPKGRGVIIPEYEPPRGFNPLTSDFLLRQKLRNEALSATLIDLAVKGYITIIEIPKSGIFGKTDYRLVLNKIPDVTFSQNQLAALAAVFGPGLAGGASVNLSDFSKSRAQQREMYEKLKDLEFSLAGDLTAGGFFVKNPKDVKQGYQLWSYVFMIAAFASGWLAVTLRSVAVAGVLIGAGLAFLVIFGFSFIMPARTQAGVAAHDALLGLKDYIKLAEADRLKFLQSPQGAEKLPVAEQFDPKTPEAKIKLFEKLLPYAMLFGLEKDWAKQFNDIYTSPPEWYQGGNWSAFNAGYLAGSLSGFNSAATTSFASPSSSSGSGFGGGGAGGGGGGGGGGGW